MSVVLLSTQNSAVTNSPWSSVSITASGGANKRVAFFWYMAESSTTTPVTLSQVKYDSAGTNISLTQVGTWNYVGATAVTVECWALKEANIQGTAKNFSWTVATGTVSGARQHLHVWDQVDQTTSWDTTNSGSLVASTGPVTAAITVSTGGAAIVGTMFLGVATYTWNNSFTQGNRVTTTGATGTAYKIADGAQTASLTAGSADSGILAVVGVKADATAIIDITSVNGGSAMTEGQSGVAIVGTDLTTGTGARIQIVGATSTNQAMDSWSTSSAIAATAAVPTFTSLPFSQNAAGTGLTTWDLEVIGVGAVNDATPVSVEVRPASGWDVVEIVTPDLSAASILSHLGWTSVATDLVSWEASVIVGAITVDITVTDAGLYTYDSTYTIGGAVAPMPSSFSWDFRAYDSASKLWTSVATVTVGGASSSAGHGGPIRSPIRSPLRSPFTRRGA